MWEQSGSATPSMVSPGAGPELRSVKAAPIWPLDLLNSGWEAEAPAFIGLLLKHLQHTTSIGGNYPSWVKMHES